ncbi:MAG: hypothetical protein RL885_24925 [Planctomycetota bacterium]
MRESYAGILCSDRDVRGERSVRGMPSVEAVREELMGGRRQIPRGFRLAVWRERTGPATRGEIVLEVESKAFEAKRRRRKSKARQEQARRRERLRTDPHACPVKVEVAQAIRAYLEASNRPWVSMVEMFETIGRRFDCARRTFKRAGRSLGLEERVGSELGYEGYEGRRLYWRLPVVVKSTSQ